VPRLDHQLYATGRSKTIKGNLMQRIVLGLLLIFTILSAEAADESLMIGSARLTPGMDRASAWGLLRQYSVKCIDGEKAAQPPTCNSWLVTSGKADRFSALGSVYFKDGRLQKIFKYYDSAQWEAKPEKFASLLYEVLRQHSKDGDVFVASIGEVRQPGWLAKSIFFRTGKRTVNVGYSEGGSNEDGKPYGPAVSLHEELE
jgi:hypothetical protein